MHIQFKWLVLLALLATQPPWMLAQASSDTTRCSNFSCCTTDLTPVGIMISHVHNKKEWMLSYRFMNMFMDGLAAGTWEKDKNDVFANYLMSPEKMNMQMHMLMGMYGITDRFTVMAMFNYQVNSMDMSMFSAVGHHHGVPHADGALAHQMKTAGPGDVKLHLLYGIIRKPTCQLLISLGTSIPTGSIHIKGNRDDAMYPNARFPYGMQLGSGTVDVLPGLNYLYQKNKIALSTTVFGTYRGGYNTLGYRFGNEATLSSWMAYQWLNCISSSIRIEGNIAQQLDGYDSQLRYYSEPAADPANYGGKRVNAYFGSSIHFKGVLKNNQLGIEFGIPLYQDLNGIQLKQQHTLTAAWSFSF